MKDFGGSKDVSFVINSKYHKMINAVTAKHIENNIYLRISFSSFSDNFKANEYKGNI